MTLLVLPEPVCTDGASGDNTALDIPLSSPADPCNHSMSGSASWTFDVLHSQVGYYALVYTIYCGANPYSQPTFVFSVDGHNAFPAGVIGGSTNVRFGAYNGGALINPFPHSVCDWPYPAFYVAGLGFYPPFNLFHDGFWLTPGTRTLSIRFGGWTWDAVQDSAPLCSSLYTAHFGQLTLVAGIPCPGYVYATPDTLALRLTVNALAPTGLRLVVPSGKHLRLTING